MPELPEVEFMRQRLSHWLGRGRVVECQVHDPRLIRPAEPRTVVDAIAGHRIGDVDRHGKWLRVELVRAGHLFVHLAMTGWFEEAPGDESLRHERARITVMRARKKTRVAYVDPRRWGRWIVAHEDIPTWRALGPDPLAVRIDLDPLLAKLARRKSRSIKEALMDQTLLAGVGNIQAIEALWKAQIDPRAPAASITRAKLRTIVRGIDWTIARTLKDLAKGDAGAADPWIAYGHMGQACPRCGTTFVRIELGGRTTTFCPGCQK